MCDVTLASGQAEICLTIHPTAVEYGCSLNALSYQYIKAAIRLAPGM